MTFHGRNSDYGEFCRGRGDGKINKLDCEQRLLREESWVRSAVLASSRYASSRILKARSNNVTMTCILMAYPKSGDTITATRPHGIF